MLAAQRCANWCTAHDWCGAFYLAWQDDHCHLIPQRESGDEHMQVYDYLGELRALLMFA